MALSTGLIRRQKVLGEITFLLTLPLLFFLAAAGHLHVTQGVIRQQMPEPPSVGIFHS